MVCSPDDDCMDGLLMDGWKECIDAEWKDRVDDGCLEDLVIDGWMDCGMDDGWIDGIDDG